MNWTPKYGSFKIWFLSISEIRFPTNGCHFDYEKKRQEVPVRTLKSETELCGC